MEYRETVGLGRASRFQPVPGNGQTSTELIPDCLYELLFTLIISSSHTHPSLPTVPRHKAAFLEGGRVFITRGRHTSLYGAHEKRFLLNMEQLWTCENPPPAFIRRAQLGNARAVR